MTYYYNNSEFLLSASVGPSAVTLSWTPLPAAAYYQLHCRTEFENITDTTECGNVTNRYVHSHTFSSCTDNATTTAVLEDKLVPGVNYTCCISAPDSGPSPLCQEGVKQGGGRVSVTMAGLIGGGVGLGVALLLTLLLVGTVIICCLHKSHK